MQWRRHHTQGQLRSQHAFAAHHPDFQCRIAVNDGHQRNEALGGKVGMPCRLAGLGQYFRQHQFDRNAEREQAQTVFARKPFYQVILDGGQAVTLVCG